LGISKAFCVSLEDNVQAQNNHRQFDHHHSQFLPLILDAMLNYTVWGSSVHGLCQLSIQGFQFLRILILDLISECFELVFSLPSSHGPDERDLVTPEEIIFHRNHFASPPSVFDKNRSYSPVRRQVQDSLQPVITFRQHHQAPLDIAVDLMPVEYVAVSSMVYYGVKCTDCVSHFVFILN